MGTYRKLGNDVFNDMGFLIHPSQSKIETLVFMGEELGLDS
jgi:hypothetical protein